MKELIGSVVDFVVRKFQHLEGEEDPYWCYLYNLVGQYVLKYLNDLQMMFVLK